MQQDLSRLCWDAWYVGAVKQQVCKGAYAPALMLAKALMMLSTPRRWKRRIPFGVSLVLGTFLSNLQASSTLVAS